MSEEIKSIKKWFELAKPNPTIEDVCVQIGCHYEEVAEMAQCAGDDCVADAANIVSENHKNKNDAYLVAMELLVDDSESKIELLDSLCDQIVTAIGVAHMLGFDIEGALNEVNNSNYSKFEDGKPVFNEQGKIAKGKDYFAPNLEKFV